MGWDVQWLIPDVERRLAHLQSERGAVSDWLVGEGVCLSLSLSLSLSLYRSLSLSFSHTLFLSPLPSVVSVGRPRCPAQGFSCVDFEYFFSASLLACLLLSVANFYAS